ncbi:FUSC family protein [Serinibacter salmoneus]|nr:FUSC family protein [Serinibacter salmoneus]
MLRPNRGVFPLGHSIRSALTVGGPFVVGVLAGDVMAGMWVGLATLLLAAGEREGSHRLNLQILLVSTPIAIAGYATGYLQGLPLWALVPVMALLAMGAGVIAGWGAAYSVGGMQFLLVAAIAIGVDGYQTWWQPMLWYLLGAVLYAAFMLLEFALDRRRPERTAVLALLRATATLAQARAADQDAADKATADHPSPVPAAPEQAQLPGARAGAVAALGQARTVYLTGRGDAAGHAAHWDAFARVLADAESVIALIPAADAATARHAAEQLRGLATGALPAGQASGDAAAPLAERLRTLASDLDALGVTPGTSGRPHGTSASGTSASATSGSTPATAAPATAGAPTGWARLAVGHDVLGAAARLALCYGIAVAAKAYFPYSHWFWVALTVALVMKPDFGSVFGRAVQRVIGTIVGVALATLVILVLPAHLAIAIAIGVFAFFVPWFMTRAYSLQAVAIAPAVILLVDIISTDATANYSWQRIAATAIGGAVVILFGYLPWRSARRVQLQPRLAAAAAALADYAGAAGTPIPQDDAARRARHEALVSSRQAATRGLSDLRMQLQRGLGEPAGTRTQALSWIPAVAAIEQVSDAVARYAGVRLAGGEVPDLPADAVEHLRALGALTDPEEVRTAAAAARTSLLGLLPDGVRAA